MKNAVPLLHTFFSQILTFYRDTHPQGSIKLDDVFDQFYSFIYKAFKCFQTETK